MDGTYFPLGRLRLESVWVSIIFHRIVSYKVLLLDNGHERLSTLFIRAPHLMPREGLNLIFAALVVMMAVGSSGNPPHVPYFFPSSHHCTNTIP